uniref:Uncharacterized protein n=1 Tax=Aegilops tauschii subsp. strangulata TaxID=200361 RepID=A0A453PNP7_AEGTS
MTSMKPLRSIPAVQPQPPVPQLKPPRRRSPPAAGGPSPMTTPGAATPPSFKRSSPRKKQRPRSRLLAADFAAGEAEAARALVAARATPPAVSPHSPVGAALPREFFEVDALDLAPRLLGKLLRRDQVVLRITEGGGLQAKRFRVPWPVRHHGENRSCFWTRRACICVSMLWTPHDAQCCCRQRGRRSCCSDPSVCSS